MSKPNYVKFCTGIMDGISFEVPAAVEKVVIQLASDRVLRYEHDQIEEFDDRTEGRLVETDHPDDFDAEMRHDEQRSA